MSQANDRLEAIFDAAVELSGPERELYLARACGGDVQLRQRVEKLLRALDRAGGFLTHAEPLAAAGGPPAPCSGELADTMPAPVTEKCGDRIGRYKLLQQIGEGGCGVVYMAEQEEPVRRRVALKVIKLGMDTREVVARFEAERQALALMDHPNIARVFDGGATDTGRPYFVLELVRGVRITEFCDQHLLPTAQRLELFIQVCHAIQHAHQKGIIHRDIKPSNILVSLHDNLPVPKVIDFGIAKAMGERLTDKTLYTRFEQFIGTPAYMSPEQAGRSDLDIDTRSDVYALGVLLYELLTGRPPFDPKQLAEAGLEAMMRCIREEEPIRPSTRWSKLEREEQTTTAHQRGTEPPKLLSLLRGDLDWIVMKCLEKDRARRYETANGLAQDLERHLKHEPVAARPPSTAYRVQKFVRRNKIMVGAAAAVAAALVLGILGSMWQAIRATRAEHEQSRLRQQAQVQAYASDMKAAHLAIQQNNRGLAGSLLERHVPKAGQPDLRGVEWRYLWDQANGTATQSLPHVQGVTDVAFSPDGRLLATAQFDKLIQLWDIASGKQVREFVGGGSLPQKRCLGFTPDGKRFVFRGRHGIEVQVRETSGWTQVTNLPCAGNSPLALSGNGKRLVLQQYREYFEMQAWDLETWECRKLRAPHVCSYALAVSADATLAAFSGASEAWPGQFLLWDIAGSHFRDTAGSNCVLLADQSDAGTFAFSPDGKWLASGHFSGEVGIWDLRSRRLIHSWRAHPGAVRGLAFSPDSARLASGGNDQVIAFWEAGTTNRLGQLTGHWGEIWCLNFSSDGRQLASGGPDGTARIWDLQTRDATEETQGLTLPTNALPICPSADGAGLFTLDEKANAVSLWSCQSGQLLWTCSSSSLQPVEGTNLVYFLKPHLAVGFGTNRVLRIWDMTNGELLRSVPLPVPSLEPACLSPDQRWLVAAAGVVGFSGGVRLFDLQSGRLVPRFGFPYDFLFAADFSPDGRLLAVAACPLGTRGDRDIHVWDLRAGKERFHCPGGTSYGDLALRFSPDSRLLARAGYDGDVQLWSAESGQPLWPPLKGHQSMAWTCSFSTDGQTLISGGADGTLRFWSVAAGQELLMLPRAAPISPSLGFRGDAHRLYRAQTDVNPVPDTLIWQDLKRGTRLVSRLVSLPTLADVDRIIARRRERLAEETGRAGARKHREAEQEAGLKAATAVDPGAIKQWLILGPIPLAQSQSEVEALDAELVRNEGQLRPRDGERVRTAGGELAWRAVRQTDYVMDFVQLLGPADRSAVYAVAYMSVPAARSHLNLQVGSNNRAKVYLNGQQAYRQTAARVIDPDQGTIRDVELREGTNVLVLKVVNVTLDWGGSVCFRDSAGNPVPWGSSVRFTESAGNPVPGIQVQLTPP